MREVRLSADSTNSAGYDEYYPSDYLSFRDADSKFLRMFLKKKANKYVMFKKGLIGRLVYKKCFSKPLDIISKTGIDCDARILDVGCGRGNVFIV